MIENKLEYNEEPKVRALVEERGGVVLDHVSKVNSEHVIRLAVKVIKVVKVVSVIESFLCRLLVRTELHPNRSYDLFKYR